MKVLVPTAINATTFASSSVAEADYAAYAGATSYALGARVILVSTHRIYESLIAGNVGHSPDISPAHWLDVAPTNRWAMFDELLTTATTNTTSIDVRANLGAVNDIVLQGVVGTSVAIFSGPTLIRTVAVPAPTTPATSVTMVITGLAIPLANQTGVVLTGTGTVAIAHISAGTFNDLGKTQRDIELEFDDFSTDEEDGFGVLSIKRRGYSRRMTVNVSILATDIDRVTALVESLLDTVCYWSAMDGYDALAMSGFYTAFDEVIAHRAGATYSLTIAGLVRDDAVVNPGPQLLAVDPWMAAAESALAKIPDIAGNLVRKASFEDWSQGNWSGAGVASHTGTAWSKHLAVNMRDTLELGSDFAVSPGDALFCTADCSTGSLYAAALGVMCKDSAGNINNFLAAFSKPANTGWERKAGLITIPAGVATCVPWIQIDGTGGGVVLPEHWWANIYIGKAVHTEQIVNNAVTETATVLDAACANASSIAPYTFTPSVNCSIEAKLELTAGFSSASAGNIYARLLISCTNVTDFLSVNGAWNSVVSVREPYAAGSTLQRQLSVTDVWALVAGKTYLFQGNFGNHTSATVSGAASNAVLIATVKKK